MSSHSRQLAAIMFTDIVGYTAMMGRNEEKALQLLQKNRQIHKPLIEKFHGKWIKEMGDGVLAQFDSAYNATKCAIEIQQKARREFKGELRIGLHIGEIIIENNDIFGDGVNVASRIESIADPGGIYISEAIHNALRNRTDIKTNYLGKIPLKNVDEPAKIFYVVAEHLKIPSKLKIKQLKAGIERVEGQIEELNAEIAKANETKTKLSTEMVRLVDEIAKHKASQDITSREKLVDLLASESVSPKGVVDGILKSPSIVKSLNQQRDNVEKLKGAIKETERLISSKNKKKLQLNKEKQVFHEFLHLLECHQSWQFTVQFIEKASEAFERCSQAIQRISDGTLKSTACKAYIKSKKLDKNGFPHYVGLLGVKQMNLTEMLNSMGRLVSYDDNPLADPHRERYAIKPSPQARAFKARDAFGVNEFMDGHQDAAI